MGGRGGREFACPRKDCRANVGFVCKALYLNATVNGRKHTIDAEYIANCPFYMTEEMYEADESKEKERVENADK